MYKDYPVYSQAIDTADTTRVPASDPIDYNTYVTKMIYPSPEVE